MGREIAEIPQAAARALSSSAIARAAATIIAARPRLVVMCGRGSSGHVGVFLRYLIETRLGVVVAASAPSVVTAYGAAPVMDGALFIAVSQSGTSPDLLAATQAAARTGALTLALVNNSASPLASLCRLVVPVEAGPEHAVAATKSVVASMLAGASLVASIAGDRELAAALARAPERLAAALALDWSSWTNRVVKASSSFVAGRGHALAPSREIALKICEVLQVPTLAYSTAELLHGPRAAMAADRPLLVLRQSDDSAALTDQVVATLRAQGLCVDSAGSGDANLPFLAPDDPVIDAIAMLIPAYRAIERTARDAGRDPDRPPYLTKITSTL